MPKPSLDGGVSKSTADRSHVVPEDAAELIVRDLADIGAPPAEPRESRHGVAAGATGGFDARRHALIERVRRGGIDQRHRPLGEVIGRDEGVVGLRHHVHQRIADPNEVVLRHLFYPSVLAARRPRGEYSGRIPPGNRGPQRSAAGPAWLDDADAGV